MEESQKTNKQKKYVNEERGRNLLGRLPGYAETAATTTLDKDSILTIFFFWDKNHLDTEDENNVYIKPVKWVGYDTEIQNAMSVYRTYKKR